MANLALTGKVLITGGIETVTGLHIGGTASDLSIGGVDNPIIRHPVSREPYIPGSSLRGKMRALLDRHHVNEANTSIGKVHIHVCKREADYDKCPVCQVFGVTPEQGSGWTNLKPARLIVRDVHLAQDAAEKLRQAKTDTLFAEVKSEVVIDRITSAAMPRTNERVPMGTVFAPFEFVYSLYDLNGTGCEADIEWLRSVFQAMEMLEDDYLGGYGSRGSGKIRFCNLVATFKPRAAYEDKAAPVVLAEHVSMSELRRTEYAEQIKASLEG